MAQASQLTNEMDKTLLQSLAPTARKIAENTQNPQNQLVTVETHAKQIEHELSQYMLLAKKRIAEGFLHCIAAVKELAYHDSEINLQNLEAELTKSFDKLDSVAHIKDMSSQVVKEGNSWKELLGLSDAVLQILYRGAKKLFDGGNHPQAEAAFFFLTTVDFKQYAFWLGLGHAAFHLRNLNQAINAYEMAESCQPGTIWPQIYIANCFEALNDFQESLTALLVAEVQLQTSPETDHHLQADIKERIANARHRA